jgi:ferritin-like metal-binding protein YciE
MALHTLEDLFVDHLKDLYNAEHQITKALPRMAKKVATNELRDALENHLQQTETQIERLEKVFQMLEKSPRGKKCMGMEGLIQEGQEVLNEDMEPVLRDSAIIAAAQKVEHYEISAYGTAIAFARLLGHEEAVKLFKETLDEESQADELLNKIAEGSVNRSAMQQGQGQTGGPSQRSSQPQGSRVPEGQSQGNRQGSQGGRSQGGMQGSQTGHQSGGSEGGQHRS